jgi:purine-binding chemotaxis protein CheW
MEEKAVAQEKQLVVFNLGEESYAVDIAVVKEIIQLQPVTRVPGTPASVEGVINLRGSVIPIVELRKRFQLNKIDRDKDTRIIVVSCKGSEVGVIVDSVAQVIRVPVASIEASSNVFADEHIEHLLGIVKLPDQLVILLDMDQVLSKQEIAAISSLEMKKKSTENKGAKEPVVACK